MVVEGVSIQGPSDLGVSVSVSHGFMSLVQQNRWLHWLRMVGVTRFPPHVQGNLGKARKAIILKVAQVLLPRN